MILKHLHVWYYMFLLSHMGFLNPIIYNEIQRFTCPATSLADQNETWALEDCRNDQGPVLNPELVYGASWYGLLLLTELQISMVAPSFFKETDVSHLCHQAKSCNLC